MLRIEKTFWKVLAVATCALVVGACRQDMHDNPRYEAYEAGGMRAPVEGTVARGSLLATPSPAAGTPAGAPAAKDAFPFAITDEVLARGQSRFNINCAPCHSMLGDGDGMIVRRGLKKPPSYHEERLRNSPASYFVDVMSNGFGAMPSYSDKLTVEDRWKVAAYIRVLQLSQHAKVDDVPPEERAKLEKGPETAQPQPHGGVRH